MSLYVKRMGLLLCLTLPWSGADAQARTAGCLNFEEFVQEASREFSYLRIAKTDLSIEGQRETDLYDSAWIRSHVDRLYEVIDLARNQDMLRVEQEECKTLTFGMRDSPQARFKIQHSGPNYLSLSLDPETFLRSLFGQNYREEMAQNPPQHFRALFEEEAVRITKNDDSSFVMQMFTSRGLPIRFEDTFLYRFTDERHANERVSARLLHVVDQVIQATSPGRKIKPQPVAFDENANSRIVLTDIFFQSRDAGFDQLVRGAAELEEFVTGLFEQRSRTEKQLQEDRNELLARLTGPQIPEMKVLSVKTARDESWVSYQTEMRQDAKTRGGQTLEVVSTLGRRVRFGELPDHEEISTRVLVAASELLSRPDREFR